MVKNEIQTKVTEACKTNAKEVDKLLLEYMQKRNLTIEDLQDNFLIEQFPFDYDGKNNSKIEYNYKGELIMTIEKKFYMESPSVEILRRLYQRYSLGCCTRRGKIKGFPICTTTIAMMNSWNL